MGDDQVSLDMGQVHENRELTNENGIRLDSDLVYNEYVVYDVGQVRNYWENNVCNWYAVSN